MIADLTELLGRFEPYYILSVAAVGFFGNSVSFFLFVCTRLRLKEVHTVLAVLAIVDNCFLAVLVLVTLRHFGIDFANGSEFGCRLSVFLPFVFGFMSIWLVVLFSLERFVVVFFPLHRHQLCNPRRSMAIVLGLLLFALAFYSFGLWTTQLERSHVTAANVTRAVCQTKEDWLEFLRVMSVVDSALTMFVPFVLIATFNVLIIVELSRKKRLPFKTTTVDYNRRRSAGSRSTSPGTAEFVRRKRLPTLLSEASSYGTVFSNKQHQHRMTQITLFPSIQERAASRAGSALFHTKSAEASGESSVSGSDAESSYRYEDSAPPSFAARGSRLNVPRRTNGRRLFATLQRRKDSFSLPRRSAALSSRRHASVTLPRWNGTKLRDANQMQHMRKKIYSRTTRMLLIISTTFLVLHGPTAALKVWYTISYSSSSISSENEPVLSAAKESLSAVEELHHQHVSTHNHSMSHQNHHHHQHHNSQQRNESLSSSSLASAQSSDAISQARPLEELLERASYFVYYLHYSLNFFLYVLNLKRFRRIFCASF